MFRLLWGSLAALGLYLGVVSLWDAVGRAVALVPGLSGWGSDGDSSGSGDSSDSDSIFGGGSLPAVPPEAGDDDEWLEPVGYGSPISEPVRSQLHPNVLEWESDIRSASERADVPSDLIAVTMHRESMGETGVLGDDGESLGLMQIQLDTQVTINDYHGTELDRTIPLHNLYLGALNLRRTHEEMQGGFFFGGPSSPTWFDAVRAYLCGVEGASSDLDCASGEAMTRLNMANLPTPNAA